MSVEKLPSGKWRAKVKHGRSVVATQSFATRRDALAWHDSEKRKLTSGEWIDPKAGAVRVADALERWMLARAGTVSGKTLAADGEALKRLPRTLTARPISSIRAADLETFYGQLLRTMARSSVTRTRDTLSAFWTWAQKDGLVSKHPVRESRVPQGTGTHPKAEVYPFNRQELLEVAADVRALCPDKDAADIVTVLGLTGLRWGELAALRVRDVLRVPYPAFSVSRSKPDGQPVRNTTKGGKPRVVPLTEDVWSIVQPRLTADPNAPLFPNERGGYRLLANWKRATHWDRYGRGRRVHDLRHTAATHWLSHGVDLKTAQTWLGHSTAKLTADTYAHWLGSDADQAAIARLNALAGSTRGPRTSNLGTARTARSQ